MRNKPLTYFSGLLVALFFVCGLTFAKSSSVNLIYRAKVGNNLVLPVGKYKVTVNKQAPAPQAEFYQDGKLVGTTPVKVVSQSSKNNQTEVFYGAPHNDVRNISQIDFSGWRAKLVFGTHATQGATGLGS
ncbi:MAG: hypothetical protein ACRD1N_12080 [Terriglobia bacterium]